MARYTGPVCRLCRRERTKLYLKGERCFTMKCPVAENSDRQMRAFPPGMHGRDRQRQGSEYLTQLREKQKARRIYGLLEKQFRNLYEEASRRPGMTGTICCSSSSCVSTTSRTAPVGERHAPRPANSSVTVT